MKDFKLIKSYIHEAIQIIDNTHGYDSSLFGQLNTLRDNIKTSDTPENYAPYAISLLQQTIDYMENVHADESAFYEDLNKFLY